MIARAAPCMRWCRRRSAALSPSFGSGSGKLLRAKFHVDGAGADIADLPVGCSIHPHAVPRRKRWLFVIGDHGVPPGLAPLGRDPLFSIFKLVVRIEIGSRSGR